ncbi:tetratricopeptide repeat protein [uncultured Pseudodesulfovibrio sp.]|uniref:tetratricopeptide repeat protein n=1 Tax=uncultured Pseudodesulfovibrio sp. TaxID=2035858 RepID=UPI0029C933E1|nr:tetratricopeptide repeat protein [uncultured Pseudodesulfovibrio sp.]
MRKSLTITTALLLVLGLALPTMAGLVNTGDRNFQRAWRVYVTRNNDKAMEYFKAAAQAYGEALQQDPLDRTMKFQSSLDKAGIAMYFAGRYDESIKVLTDAQGEKDKIWDAALFIALSQGRKGDQEAALKAFDKFLEANPSQRMISSEMARVLPGVQKGTIKLADAIDAIEQATQQQFVQNVQRYNNRNGMMPATNACNGPYWWRYNSAPCSSSVQRYL